MDKFILKNQKLNEYGHLFNHNTESNSGELNRYNST